MNIIEAVEEFSGLTEYYQPAYQEFLAEGGRPDYTLMFWLDCAESLFERYFAGNGVELKSTVALIEKFLIEGDNATQTMVCTVYLEALVNRSDDQGSAGTKFLQQFGEQAKLYMRAYNDSHGVKNLV